MIIKRIFWLLGFCWCLPLVAQQAETPPPYPWLDNMHSEIADSVQATAQWFDDFFALNNACLEQQKASGEARIRLSWEPRSRDLSQHALRFRVRVKLPNLKNQADLVFSDYDESSPVEPIEAARNNLFDPDQDRFNLALRWRSKSKGGLSHRIGTGRRFQIYARSRYQKDFSLSETNTLKSEFSIAYYNRDKFNATVKVSVNHQFNDTSIFRFSNNYYYRERSKDWLWQHGFQHLSQFKDNAALISGFYLEGSNQPNYQLNEYLLSMRWRQNTLRHWLFYEIEPFVLWRRDEHFSASYGIALRLEGYFDKK